MPVWLRVNPVNTPNAYSGISLEMSPLNATISAPATSARNSTPFENTRRAPLLKNWRGRNPSRAMIEAEAREVGVRGVRGEDQDQERGDHREPEHDALAAVEVLGHQPEAVAVVLAPVRLQVRGQHRHAEEAAARGCAPIHISVVAAFLLSGFWNAGTPLDTASTPDNATAPDENARSSISRLSALAPVADLARLRR